MSYLTYLFTLIYDIMVSISIPIPIYIGAAPVYLSIYTIIMGMISLGIMVYFVSKLLGIEVNAFWAGVTSDLSKPKNAYSGEEIVTISKAGLNSDGTNNYSVNTVRRYRKKL